ncbi:MULTISPECIES: hypothetical protein [unclassified Nocardioides]|uniref:hypothetical protein n=1 Tax=unclassified Nocardioides TaxID=2615069 RepID=UPI0009F1257D|nr:MULTISPECIES: hypothetical protein [unclassified Nocardioides]GAW50518.1 hypothetical protein PD653B2_2853 [Nocardioides sp. PD653-B2]
MDDTRFWQLVDLLGGTADERTVPVLEADLAASGDAEGFLDALQVTVDDLLARCPVPGSHEGDTAEWIAAAVVAAGRETYERTIAAGLPSTPMPGSGWTRSSCWWPVSRRSPMTSWASGCSGRARTSRPT